MRPQDRAPRKIYLIPTGDDEGFVWCDTAAPGEGMDEADAIEYVRADCIWSRVEKEMAQYSREATDAREEIR